jgi:hypothetical protein
MSNFRQILTRIARHKRQYSESGFVLVRDPDIYHDYETRRIPKSACASGTWFVEPSRYKWPVERRGSGLTPTNAPTKTSNR